MNKEINVQEGDIRISKYWQHQLKKEFATVEDLRPGRTYVGYKNELGCDECCNGDRCDDPTHRHRSSCHACLGSGKNRSCYDEAGNVIVALNTTNK